MRQNSSVTLLEIMVVLIIIATLAILALPQLNATKEMALDKEAQANLKLIQAAEKIYRMEVSIYVSCSDRAAINSSLLLDIPPTRNWNYKIDVASGLFTGKAQRTDKTSHVWCVERDTLTPYDEGGGCSW